jgi:WD40 repeat protein
MDIEMSCYQRPYEEFPKDGAPIGFTLKRQLHPEFGASQVSWSHEGNYLAAGSTYGVISIWDVVREEQLGLLEKHDGWCVTTDWSPDGRFIASGGGDAIARIWSFPDLKLYQELQGHDEYIRRVAWSPDGALLASASDDATVRLWDAKTGDLVATLKGHTDRVYGLAWLPDCKTILSGSLDGTVRRWQLIPTVTAHTFASHRDSVWSIACSNDGSRLASSGHRTIQVWDVQTELQLTTLPGGGADFLSFSADGRILAARYHQTTRLWDCDKALSLAVLYEPTVASSPPDPAFHPSATELATVTDDYKIRIWDLDLNLLQKEASITLSCLREELVALYDVHRWHPQKAGFALEGFLNKLFALEELAPRKSFRVVGEQIDGSFELDDETYLLEAKWEKDPLSESALLSFRGKIEGKSSFTRGVLVAINGVSSDATKAIAIGKQLTFFVMDGNDLTMILAGRVGLRQFLRERRRLLAEEGAILVPFDTIWS